MLILIIILERVLLTGTELFYQIKNPYLTIDYSSMTKNKFIEETGVLLNKIDKYEYLFKDIFESKNNSKIYNQLKNGKFLIYEPNYEEFLKLKFQIGKHLEFCESEQARNSLRLSFKFIISIRNLYIYIVKTQTYYESVVLNLIYLKNNKVKKTEQRSRIQQITEHVKEVYKLWKCFIKKSKITHVEMINLLK
ncbi:hypothetical protein TUBRATIS_30970 [Tubulinosema ratisbonensis]|uniref:Uncharacterized protein n=1 Tax=Tubulinosema ratisbonensis TaxID=291195 RepID=A0A437AHE2_9MICR|nr:hypothetical protein TUBRATIS_30970 [Tubulinosema ratisbonensis]